MNTTFAIQTTCTLHYKTLNKDKFFSLLLIFEQNRGATGILVDIIKIFSFYKKSAFKIIFYCIQIGIILESYTCEAVNTVKCE